MLSQYEYTMQQAANAKRRAELETEISELRQREYLVATNQGTYSANEAQRATGTGDPRHNDRNEYETVGGVTRSTGPDNHPGRMRRFGEQLRHDRAALRGLQRELEKISN